jgi:ceramide glucosyltransferase
MSLTAATEVLLAVAAIPFVYYLLVLYSTTRFFLRSPRAAAAKSDFTPPVSILKPVRGLDPEAYENFASFCRQDYPEYEVIFCLGSVDDPVLPVIQRLQRDFPPVPSE